MSAGVFPAESGRVWRAAAGAEWHQRVLCADDPHRRCGSLCESHTHICCCSGVHPCRSLGTSADSPDLIQNRLDIIFANEDCFLFFCLVTFLSAFTLKGSFMFCSDASVSPSSPQVHGSVLVYLQPGGLQPQPHPSLSCCPQNPSASNSALRDSIQRPAVCLHLQVWQMTA